MQKFGTKSEFKVWKTEWRFFSNSKVIKSHSQPIRIEHQLSLNWSRNSITKKWRRRLGITSENYLLYIILWYPSTAYILDVILAILHWQSNKLKFWTRMDSLNYAHPFKITQHGYMVPWGHCSKTRLLFAVDMLVMVSQMNVTNSVTMASGLLLELVWNQQDGGAQPHLSPSRGRNTSG